MKENWRAALVTCLVAFSAIPAASQNRALWQGSVIPERIAVYESNSTDSGVINTLAQGDVVGVILQVRVSGADWCRVANIETSEPLGFVLCLNLRKGSTRNRGAVSTANPPSTLVTASVASQGSSGSVLTNKDILELHKAGLSEQVVIAKIKSSQCDFDTSPSRLSQLKSAGVADSVILAMVEAPDRKSAPSSMSPSESSGTLPKEPGMYVAANGAYTKILGQIVEFERTGSLLVSRVTLGVKSAKGNAQLLGGHAATVVPASATFYFLPAKQEGDAGVNAGDLILIRLEEKGERRQFEVEALGDMRESKGITLTHQIQLERSEVAPGVFKIVPAGELGQGEYGLYLARGEGLAPYIYDFSIQ